MKNGAIDPNSGDLNYNSVAPWIAWGPYLWANGTNPRSDGLTYAVSDFTGDGTHPAIGATKKVGCMLLNFFLTSPYSYGWFTVNGTVATPKVCW